jgi:hypothetical protein
VAGVDRDLARAVELDPPIRAVGVGDVDDDRMPPAVVGRSPRSVSRIRNLPAPWSPFVSTLSSVAGEPAK